MYRMSSEFAFSSQHKRVLRDLTIGEDGPGTILQDFATMLAYLKGRDLRLTGKHQLPLRSLPEINARLARPLQLGLTRPMQKSYPHIHGLYLLVRASGLTYVESTAKKPLLVVDEVVLRSWESLNPTERYCSLLETWLLRGHSQIIEERGQSMFLVPDTFRNWASVFRYNMHDEGMQVAGDDQADSTLRYLLGWYNLGLLELFGLVSVQHGPPEPKKGWQAVRAWRTPLGDALLALLYVEFFDSLDNILNLETEGQVPYGVLQPALQPHFPDWKNNPSLPERAFQEGTHVFRVSLWQEIWRQIAIPARLTLDDLAYAILNAYEFDHDHLWRFSYQSRSGLWKHVNHSYMDEGPWTDKVRIGDVPLRVGQTMTYLFDFGDYWEFDVTLERIDPPDASLQAPVVLKAHGEPPEQYGTWVGWE